MDYNDPVTRRAIVAMLYRIKEQTCVIQLKEKLFIEAFPVGARRLFFYISTCANRSQ